MAEVSNPPVGQPQVVPRINYEDVGKAVAFLTEAFGFREREEARLTNADGSVSMTDLELGAGVVMVGEAGAHDVSSPRSLGGRSVLLIVYVDDVDGHASRARAAGAELLSEPTDMPWGDRRYEALDLEGHRWAFHEHVRDVPREEWGF